MVTKSKTKKSPKTNLAKCLDAGATQLKRRGRGIDAERKAWFLRELLRSPVVGVAARRSGLTVSIVYRERDKNALFRAAWDEALTGAVDGVEQVLVEKAHAGEIKAIEMVLKAHRPDKYRDRHEVAVVADSVIEVSLVKVDKSLVSGDDGVTYEEGTDGTD